MITFKIIYSYFLNKLYMHKSVLENSPPANLDSWSTLYMASRTKTILSFPKCLLKFMVIEKSMQINWQS